MIGGIAAGSLAGKQQAQQENDAEQQQQQRLALQGLQIQQSAMDADAARTAAPYEALKPMVGQMRPDQVADFYTKYTNAVAPHGPGIDYNTAARAFDPDSPMRAMLTRLGSRGSAVPPPGGGMPGGGMPAGAPAGPTAPPVDRMAGGPSGTPTAVQPGGAVPPPPGAVPGAVPGAKPVPTVQAPFGSFGIGPDPHQVAATRGELARMAPRFGGKDLPPEFRQQADGLIAQANQQLESGDLEGARHSMAALQGLEADIPRQAHVGGAGLIETLYRHHTQRLNQLKTKTAKGGGAYADVAAVFDQEKQLEEANTAHPDLAATGAEDLLPYKDQIEEMRGQFEESRALRSKKDRTPADEARIKDLDKSWTSTAESLHDTLHYGVNPAARTAGLGAVRGYLAMLPPDQRTPENVAKLLEANGNKEMAAVVRDRGLNFAGADAEKETVNLMKGLSEIMRPGTPDEVRKAFTDRIGIASQLTGHPVSLDPALLERPSLKNIKGTKEYQAALDAHDKAVLEIARMKAVNKVEIQGGKWAAAGLDLQIKAAKRDQALGLFDPALDRSAAVAKIRNSQHGTDALGRQYSAWLAQARKGDNLPLDFDPSTFASQSPEAQKAWRQANPEAAAGVDLYNAWKKADSATQSMIATVPHDVRAAAAARQRGAAATPTAKPAAAAAGKRAAAPGTAPSQQQIRETYYQGLLKSGASPHEANVLMQHRFPGGQ